MKEVAKNLIKIKKIESFMLTMREMNVGEAFEAGYANEVSLRRNGAVLKKDGYLFEITRKGVNGIRVTRIK